MTTSTNASATPSGTTSISLESLFPKNLDDVVTLAANISLESKGKFKKSALLEAMGKVAGARSWATLKSATKESIKENIKESDAEVQNIELVKALEEMLGVWETVCSANGWDPDHMVQYINAKEVAKKNAGRAEDHEDRIPHLYAPALIEKETKEKEEEKNPQSTPYYAELVIGDDMGAEFYAQSFDINALLDNDATFSWLFFEHVTGALNRTTTKSKYEAIEDIFACLSNSNAIEGRKFFKKFDAATSPHVDSQGLKWNCIRFTEDGEFEGKEEVDFAPYGGLLEGISKARLTAYLHYIVGNHLDKILPEKREEKLDALSKALLKVTPVK